MLILLKVQIPFFKVSYKCTRIATTSLVMVQVEFQCAGKISAVICVAYTNQIPINEDELSDFNDFNGSNAIFYTVWSYKKGAGREIIQKVSELLHKKQWITRYVTLSPLTEMAEKFHLRNGAKLINKGDTCQNFEYFMEEEDA